MNIRANHWNYNWLDIEKAPFVFSNKYNGPQIKWTGFDDVKSFEYKVRFLKEAGLGGAMLFSLDTEDFDNDCEQGKFPLLRVINHHLNKEIKVEYPDHNQINDRVKTQFNYISMDSQVKEFLNANNITNQNGGFL